MSAFSITPLTNVPPPTAEEFPNFIQFRSQGTDLGGPDADTVNFTGGLTATRGTGENSNVVTVTGGTASGPSLLELNNLPDPPVEAIMLFDGVPFTAHWMGSALIASDDWSFTDSQLIINTAGMYRLTCTCTVEAETEWPDGATTYGSLIDGVAIASQARTHTTGDPTDTRTLMQWTDQHFLTVFEGDEGSAYNIGLYALAEETTHVVLFSRMKIVIDRLGD